jgi:hypothetical protein
MTVALFLRRKQFEPAMCDRRHFFPRQDNSSDGHRPRLQIFDLLIEVKNSSHSR